jgi:hypothetical protein
MAVQALAFVVLALLGWWWVPAAYLTLGALCTAMLRWDVRGQPPLWALAWFVFSACMLMPLNCAIVRQWPWHATMAIWFVKR